MAAKKQTSGKTKAGTRSKRSASDRQSAKRARTKPAAHTRTDIQADELAKAIDRAAGKAQESVTAYADLAKQAAMQLAGDAPTDAGKWLQLTAKSYVQAVGDTQNAWLAYNDVLKALVDQTGPKPNG